MAENGSANASEAESKLSLEPASGTLETGASAQFTAPFGPFPVTWSVNGIVGGNSTIGTVDSNGKYVAPQLPPNAMVTLTASLPDVSADASALSASASINVVNPVPNILTLSPAAVSVGVSGANVAISGAGFNASSQVTLDGQLIGATLLDSQHLAFELPSTATELGHIAVVTVSNAAPGGGSSAASLSILNPAPVAISASPATLFENVTASVTLLGSGFVPTSFVIVNGQSVPTSYLSSSQLQFTISSSEVSSSSPPSISVNNSTPGGGRGAVPQISIISNGDLQNTNNPQVASYIVTIPDGAQAGVQFGQQDYGLSTSTTSVPLGGGAVRILVAGMKPNSEYHMRAFVNMPDGSVITDTDHTFNSGSLPQAALPVLNVTTNNSSAESPGIQLFDDIPLNPSAQSVTLFAADRDGSIIWTYPNSRSETYQPVKLLDNGNIIVNTTTEIREFNLAGETINSFTIDQVNNSLNAAGLPTPLITLHHDLQKLQNGHYLLLGNIFKSVILEGSPTPTQVLGDVIIDLDSNLNVTWFWNSFDHLDVNRHPVNIDWTHSNALQYLSVDGNLLLSMRHQGWILKIDYENGTGNGDILWKLGWEGDFSLPGAPMEWFSFQHDPTVLSDDGNIMRLAIFDNGNTRFTDPELDYCSTVGQIACYSRALIMDVNEQEKTASVEFEKNLGLFSFFGGSAQVAANGNFFAGITVTGTGGRAQEITTDSSAETVWQMDVVGQNAYRSLRLPSLYPGVQWP